MIPRHFSIYEAVGSNFQNDNMKQLILFFLFFCSFLNLNAQHFLEDFKEENYDTWGTANLNDEFGEASNTIVYTYVTKGYYKDIYNKKSEIYVVVLVNFEDDYISFDLYTENLELINKINYDGLVFIKNVKSNEVKKYYFSQRDWCTLLADFINYKDEKTFLARSLINGNGETLKFKMNELDWGYNKNKGEYYFNLVSWDKNLKEGFEIEF